MIKEIHILAMPIILFMLSMPVFACLKGIKGQDDYRQTARYSYEKVAVKDEQKELLSVVVDLKFPQEVKNVGEALHYLLIPSGFELENPDISDESQYFLYDLNLPEVHRELGPIKLREALVLLGNRGFELVTNPVQRTVGYRLRTEYVQYLNEKAIEDAKNKWLKNQNTHKSVEGVTGIGEFSKTELGFRNNKYYGPVKNGETLSSIVKLLHPKSTLSKTYFRQCLVVYYQNNLSSFINSNMNLLMEGSHLDIQTDKKIRIISDEDAIQVVRSHVAAWKNPNERKGDE